MAAHGVSPCVLRRSLVTRWGQRDRGPLDVVFDKIARSGQRPPRGIEGRQHREFSWRACSTQNSKTPVGHQPTLNFRHSSSPSPSSHSPAALNDVTLALVRRLSRALPRYMPPHDPSQRLLSITRQFDLRPSPTSSPLLSINQPSPSLRRFSTSTQDNSNMSTQPEHPALLIPGPIEFDDAVLQSMSHYSESHVGAPFVATFSETLSMLRKLFQTTDSASQPFVVSGSGTLGWDLVAANLVEPGEDVLVLHTGYFADSFTDCFETYGAKVKQLKAPIGERPQLPEIEKELKEKKYKVLTVTHVDTSTGVLSELKALSELVHRVSPETLLIVDGVCSVGSEEIEFEKWQLDGVITASQKGIGCPAGLSISMFSGRAIKAFQARKTPPGSYFASMKNWLPIMQNYEAKKASYFATPSPQLIHALHTSLTQILSRPLSERFAKHREVSQRVKKAVADLGLKQLASNPADQANGMTAIYLPEGVAVPDIIPNLMKKKIIFAGGLHKQIATKYIRFGHMGVSVTDPNRDHIDRAIEALGEGLKEAGYQKA